MAIAQSVVVHLAVIFGLGRHRSHMSTNRYLRYSKVYVALLLMSVILKCWCVLFHAWYAGQILELTPLCPAKVSLIFVFMRLTPSKPASIALRIFTATIALWAMAGGFALLFQCERPDLWNLSPGRCYNQVCLRCCSVRRPDLLMVMHLGHYILH